MIVCLFRSLVQFLNCEFTIYSSELVFKYCGQLFAIDQGFPTWGTCTPRGQGYICLSEGVHLRLSTDEQNIFAYNLFPNI